MPLSRRAFLRTAAAGGGLMFCPCGLSPARALLAAAQAPAPARRQIVVGGQRVRTIDMHAHVFVNDAWPLVKDLPQVDRAMANLGASPMAIDPAAMDRRFREMDRQGIDVHVISVHPSQFLYFTEPGLAARIVKMQNEKIAELVAAHRGSLRRLRERVAAAAGPRRRAARVHRENARSPRLHCRRQRQRQ